ncbi:MAG: hypothetical protein AAF725_10735 [Acidobacteriota bacterium]
MPKIMIALSLALASLAALPLHAESGSGAVCYNCSNFSGYWSCEGGGAFGGSSCTVSQDSCTVSGDCGSVDGSQQVHAAASLVREVGRVSPEVAVTLARIAQQPRVSSKLTVHWADIEFNQESVERVLAGDQLEGSTPGLAVMHEVKIERLDDTTARLVMNPHPRSVSRSYEEFALLLESEGGDSVLKATFWHLR